MSTGRLSRQVVYGKNGMVCSNSPLSAAAGLKVLQAASVVVGLPVLIVMVLAAASLMRWLREEP